jgi:hypothetical protein
MEMQHQIMEGKMADQPSNEVVEIDLNKDDILDILEEPDEKEVLDLEKPKKETKEKEDKEDEPEAEEEEVDELKELEDEIKEPDETDLELMTPARRRDILREFPDLFKKFPYLEKAYYREQKFTETFPTIEDAVAAKSKADSFDKLESTVMETGDLSSILQTVKAESEESFNRVVDNFLPALQKASEPAFYHVLGNVIKNTILSMVTEAQNLGENGEPLKAAANILNQFVFGTQNFTKPQSLSKPVDHSEKGKEDELKAREAKFAQERYDVAYKELQERTDNVLKATIDNNIDPKKSMTDYVRKNAVRDAFEKLESLVGSDARFKSLLDRLWENAAKENFSQSSRDRIKSAYLSKAKTLLPTVIKQARLEALKGSKSESSPRKGPITPGRSASPSTSREAKEIPKGMKTIDFLMQD